MPPGPSELPWSGESTERAFPDWLSLTSYCAYSIHERSARQKIGIDNVAHVLNDEVSRKYIQSVKR
jgi:hypothetical protein